MRQAHVDKLRARFNQLREARNHGCNMTPGRIWDVWKVDRETWSHEYWLLTLELKQIKIQREGMKNEET